MMIQRIVAVIALIGIVSSTDMVQAAIQQQVQSQLSQSQQIASSYGSGINSINGQVQAAVQNQLNAQATVQSQINAQNIVQQSLNSQVGNSALNAGIAAAAALASSNSINNQAPCSNCQLNNKLKTIDAKVNVLLQNENAGGNFQLSAAQQALMRNTPTSDWATWGQSNVSPAWSSSIYPFASNSNYLSSWNSFSKNAWNAGSAQSSVNWDSWCSDNFNNNWMEDWGTAQPMQFQQPSWVSQSSLPNWSSWNQVFSAIPSVYSRPTAFANRNSQMNNQVTNNQMMNNGMANSQWQQQGVGMAAAQDYSGWWNGNTAPQTLPIASNWNQASGRAQVQDWNANAQNWNSWSQYASNMQGWNSQSGYGQGWGSQAGNGQGWNSNGQSWNSNNGWNSNGQGWNSNGQGWNSNGQGWNSNGQGWNSNGQGWNSNGQGWNSNGWSSNGYGSGYGNGYGVSGQTLCTDQLNPTTGNVALTCPTGTVISVTAAAWGTNPGSCPTASTFGAQCTNNVTSTVARLCAGQSQCNFGATVAVLGTTATTSQCAVPTTSTSSITGNNRIVVEYMCSVGTPTNTLFPINGTIYKPNSAPKTVPAAFALLGLLAAIINI